MIKDGDKKEYLALRDYIDLCCIEAQKCIGLDDFDVWEKRRKGAEKRIRELLKEEFNQCAIVTIARGRI